MVHSVMNTKAFVAHFPLALAAFDLAGVLHSFAQDVHRISLLVLVLLSRRIPDQVDPGVVVAVGVVVLE